MMNLDKIFKNDIVNLGTKFDYIYSLEIKWVLKWFKKISKLEPFTLDNLEKIESIFSKLWIKYIYFIKDEYFDLSKMLFLKWKEKTNIYIDIYISKSLKILNLLENKLNEENNEMKKNFLVWKLLWYPTCCIKSFLQETYSWDVNFNINIRNKTVWKFDWRLNNLINPYSLIPFFPCSYNCKKAINYAEKNLEIIWNRKNIEEIFKKNMMYNWVWDY